MPARAQPGSVLGIDTHKLTHVAAIVDGLGRMQGAFAFAATDAGAAELLSWASSHGSHRPLGSRARVATATSSPGRCRPPASPCARSTGPTGPTDAARGKSDPVDAEAAARAVLAGQAMPSRRTVKDPSNPYVR